MAMPAIAPYGSWQSPITADLIVQDAVRLGAVQLDGDDVYWVEMRPADGARNVIVRRTPDGAARDVTDAPFNVRTRVHEYGGRCFWVAAGVVWFANFADQRVYRQEPGAAPVAIRPPGWTCASATACWTGGGAGWCACARITHGRTPRRSTRLWRWTWRPAAPARCWCRAATSTATRQ